MPYILFYLLEVDYVIILTVQVMLEYCLAGLYGVKKGHFRFRALGTFWVPTTRIIVLRGLYWSSPISGRY